MLYYGITLTPQTDGSGEWECALIRWSQHSHASLAVERSRNLKGALDSLVLTLVEDYIHQPDLTGSPPA